MQLDMDVCEACGTEAPMPISGGYAVWQENGATTDYPLCPRCAITLSSEIARQLPPSHFDVLADVVQREVVRREEREAVAA
jgi:hypothetical protein